MRSAQMIFCQDSAAVSTKNYPEAARAQAAQVSALFRPRPSNLSQICAKTNTSPICAQFVGLVAGAEGVPAFVLVDGQGHVKEVGEDLVAQ